jgi:hypothetical protein
MNQCLKDETLLLLYEGEETNAQRKHLKECAACAARYRRLENDIGTISRIFREQPPPKTIARSSRLFSIRWLPTTAALATGLLLMLVGVRLWRPSTQPPLPQASNSDSWSVLDDLPSNPLLLNEALAAELATEGGGSYDLAAAALEIERPCEWYDLPALGRIESATEELDFSEESRPPPCIETEQNNGKRLQKHKLSNHIFK